MALCFSRVRCSELLKSFTDWLASNISPDEQLIKLQVSNTINLFTCVFTVNPKTALTRYFTRTSLFLHSYRFRPSLPWHASAWVHLLLGGLFQLPSAGPVALSPAAKKGMADLRCTVVACLTTVAVCCEAWSKTPLNFLEFMHLFKVPL